MTGTYTLSYSSVSQDRLGNLRLGAGGGHRLRPQDIQVVLSPHGQKHERDIIMSKQRGEFRSPSFIHPLLLGTLFPRWLLYCCWEKAHLEGPGPGTPGPPSACQPVHSHYVFPELHHLMSVPRHVANERDYSDLIRRSTWFLPLFEANYTSFISSILAINVSSYTQIAVCFSFK